MKTKTTILILLLTSTLLQACGTLCSEAKDGAQCYPEREHIDRMEHFEHMGGER